MNQPVHKTDILYHTGQRTLKMAGDAYSSDQNAWSLYVGSTLDHVTMYPSPYMVLSEHGYTKHYYAGADRVAARIGGGNLNHDTRCVAYDDSVVYRAEERKRKLMKNEE